MIVIVASVVSLYCVVRDGWSMQRVWGRGEAYTEF